MSYVDQRSKVKSFLNQKNDIKIAMPAPKFKVNDYIFNGKFKVLCKVVGLNGVFENEDGTVNYDGAQYILLDIKNSAFEKWMLDHGGLIQQNVKKVRKRYKSIQSIDFGYQLISAEAAQILYGVKTEETKDENDIQSDS